MKYTPGMAYLDRMIDQAIDQLADDKADSGVELLQELAIIWKSAGMTQQSFMEICTYIQNEASDRSDSAFIDMKMSVALKKAREKRTKSVILQ